MVDLDVARGPDQGGVRRLETVSGETLEIPSLVWRQQHQLISPGLSKPFHAPIVAQQRDVTDHLWVLRLKSVVEHSEVVRVLIPVLAPAVVLAHLRSGSTDVEPQIGV